MRHKHFRALSIEMLCEAPLMQFSGMTILMHGLYTSFCNCWSTMQKMLCPGGLQSNMFILVGTYCLKKWKIQCPSVTGILSKVTHGSEEDASEGAVGISLVLYLLLLSFTYVSLFLD
jgi:hypothetical protein